MNVTPVAVPDCATSAAAKPVTSSLKTTSNKMGNAFVGSACAPCWLMVTVGGVISVAVAVNVCGDPASPTPVAVSEFAPGTGPSCHEPTAAIPFVPVTALAPVTEPPPEATAKVIERLGRGLVNASDASTAGAMGTVVPVPADWPSPACFCRAGLSCLNHRSAPFAQSSSVKKHQLSPTVDVVVRAGVNANPSMFELLGTCTSTYVLNFRSVPEREEVKSVISIRFPSMLCMMNMRPMEGSKVISQDSRREVRYRPTKVYVPSFFRSKT